MTKSESKYKQSELPEADGGPEVESKAEMVEKMGIHCPRCGVNRVRVYSTKDVKDGRLRYRKCTECNYTFSNLEKI